MIIQNKKTQNTSQNTQQQNKDGVSKSGRSRFTSLIVIILIIVSVVFIVQKVTNKDNSSNPTLTTRKASINDINIQSNENNLISLELEITPKYDIDDLEITIDYYSSSKTLLKTITKYIGNVKENGKYTEQVYITDFSVSQVLELSYCKYRVTRGRVSYFA